MPESKIILGLKINTELKGIAALLTQPWHLPVLEEIFRRENANSRQMHDYCIKNKIAGKREGSPISRASVIFFLNKLVDMGILGYGDETGKGGHHRRYHAAMTRDAFIVNSIYTVLLKFNAEFPDQFDIATTIPL